MKLLRGIFLIKPNKRYARELKQLYEFAEQHPDDARVHLRIADLLLKMDQQFKAIEEYLHAAKLYEANGMCQIAAAIYKQIISIDPQQIDIYHSLADLYCREGVIGDAVATYERLARHYYDCGLRDKVIETLEAMFSIDPQSIYVKKKIARFYAEKRLTPESIDDKSHGLDWELADDLIGHQSSGSSSIQTARTQPYFDLGAELENCWETDLLFVEETNTKNENNRETMAGFDEIFREIRQEGVAAGGQDDSLYHYNLGAAYYKLRRFKEACEELALALKNPQRSVDCYLMLAVCAREQMRYKESIRYLKKALKHKDLATDRNIALRYELALTYKMKGKLKKAQKLFKTIYDANSNFRDIQKELAEVS